MVDRRGILLINLGSPASPSISDVRAYLREFLSDSFVLDLPRPLRWFLLHAIILPFRPKRSAEAYRSIWRDGGSPLILHTLDLARKLQERFSPEGRVRVRAAMRYGTPSIQQALQAFREEGITRIHGVPLYPQFAGATTGTAMDVLYREAFKEPWRPLYLSVEPPFYNMEGFAALWARRVRESLSPSQGAGDSGFVLFSFHGLPLRQIHRSGDEHCLTEGCCDRAPDHCYRAQCLGTARAVADLVGLERDRWGVSFQSRLGRDEWLGPSTESRLRELAGNSEKNVLVVPLSFVADCLETLEELGIRGREVFESAGGGRFVLLPSLNGDADWVDFLFDMLVKKI